MPELPDLELFAANLRRHFVGRQLTNLKVYDIFRVTAVEADFRKQLADKSLQTIGRDGKELFFQFAGSSFSIHLMLKGCLSLHASDESVEEIKYKCAAFIFGDRLLLVSDPGKMCRITLQPARAAAPDVLSPAFTKDYFLKKLLSRKKMSVKEFLTDQKIMRGIGNAYSDEILYDCRIAPDSICAEIPADAADRLYRSITAVLKDAIAQLQLSCPDAISGEYRGFLKVHRKDLTVTQSGALIRVFTSGGIKTYYTDEQIRYAGKTPF